MTKIKDLKNKIGQKINLEAKISSIKNISGKTLVNLNDETGNINAYSRSEINIMPGQKINFLAKVYKDNGETSLEILSIQKKIDFLIDSQNLKKFEKAYRQIAREIKNAIKNKSQIIIRHHDDTDGYTAGFVLEKAIISIIDSDKPHQFYSRKSCRTPFYDYIDALVDLNYYLSAKKYGEKPPLIILTDLGSNEQSIRAIKRLKKYAFRFVIIDHHRFDEENKETVDVFLNTHDKGLGSDICAGALASELAHHLNSKLDLSIFPALAGTADKSDSEEHEKYVELSGLSKEYLKKWALVVDHETYHMRFPERTEFLEDMFSLKKEQVEELYEDIQKDMKRLEMAVEKYAEIKECDGFKFLLLDKGKVSDRDYASSKLASITHGLEEGPRITFVISHESMISYRADEVDFSGIDLLEKLRQRFPYALISGGGHDFAGAIKYVEAAHDEVMDFVFEYLRCSKKII